ncbi:MAG: hypothetical protein ACXVRJ_11575 [Gaiellaceae bacterium]
MRIVALLAATLALAGCGAGMRTVTETTTTTVEQPRPSVAPGPQNAGYFGQIVSVTKADPKRFLLVLRPQSYLVGVTANVASAAQQGKQCEPLSCPGTEDDRLVVPAGSQSLTFVLPVNTTGTVLTLSGGKTHTTEVSAAQLAALVAGAKTPKLVEPLVSGVWLAVDVDRITNFAQQFQP